MWNHWPIAPKILQKRWPRSDFSQPQHRPDPGHDGNGGGKFGPGQRRDNVVVKPSWGQFWNPQPSVNGVNHVDNSHPSPNFSRKQAAPWKCIVQPLPGPTSPDKRHQVLDGAVYLMEETNHRRLSRRPTKVGFLPVVCLRKRPIMLSSLSWLSLMVWSLSASHHQTWALSMFPSPTWQLMTLGLEASNQWFEFPST